MGEAYDRAGSFLGETTRSTDSIPRTSSDAAEVRIRSLEAGPCNEASAPTTTGHRPVDDRVSLDRVSLDRRMERYVNRLREQSSASSQLYYQANQLAALMDCLPRVLPPAASEGLQILFSKAGI